MVSLSISQLVEAEQRAKQHLALESSREAWGEEATQHDMASGARPAAARLSSGANTPPHAPLSSAGTPSEARHTAADGSADPLRQKRLEAEEEVLFARRKALQRFPSTERLHLPEQRVLRRAEHTARARPLTKRELFLHRLMREANASSAGPGGTPARLQPPVPEWKEKILERAKVSVLAPGRTPPKLFRSVPMPGQAQPRPATAGAGTAQHAEAAASPARSPASLEPRRGPLRTSSSLGQLVQSRVGRGPFSASSARYLVQAVRELEQPEGEAEQHEQQREAELAERAEGEPLSLYEAFAPEARKPGPGQPRAHRRVVPPGANRAAEMVSAERRLFYYTDCVAKQELEANYLKEKEERLHAQIEEQLLAESAPVDSRFAHIEDHGDNLLLAAQLMRTRLFERLSLAETRVNETLAVQLELREAIQLLRKQRVNLLTQLNRANSRAASLAHDSKHMAHVAHSAVDDGSKVEAKLERSRHEYEWESEVYGKNVAVMESTAAELDSRLLDGIEEADRGKELHRQEQWSRLHAHRRRAEELLTRHGALQDSNRYLEAKLATVCQLVGVKYDGVLQASMTAEILNSYKTREAHNTSLWRTADEQTQLRQSLQAEVDQLSQLAARLEKDALERAAKEERSLDDLAESAYEDLEVLTQEIEPTVDALLEPVGSLFHLLNLYESDQLSHEAGVAGLTRETLCDHMHAVDIGVRALQLRAQSLLEKRGGAASESLEVLRLFVRNLHLSSAPQLDSAQMRTAVLQQVARMETLIMGTVPAGMGE